MYNHNIDTLLQNELTDNDVSGALCIRKPWPGIARTIWGDHERYLNTYFNPFPGILHQLCLSFYKSASFS